MKYVQKYNDFYCINESGYDYQSEISYLLKDIEIRLFPELHLNGWDIDAGLVNISGSNNEIRLTDIINIVIVHPGIQSGSVVDMQSSLEHISKVCNDLDCEAGIDDTNNIIDVTWKNETSFRQLNFQIKIIPVESLEWARFLYCIPEISDQGNVYSSLYRLLFFQSITDVVQHKICKFGKDWENAKAEDVHMYDRYLIDPQRGLMQSRMNYRGKTGRLKNPVEQGTQTKVTVKPSTLIRFLFGDKFRIKQVSTFEDCWKSFNSSNFRYKDQRKEIISRFLELVQGQNLPTPQLIQ